MLQVKINATKCQDQISNEPFVGSAFVKEIIRRFESNAVDLIFEMQPTVDTPTARIWAEAFAGARFPKWDSWEVEITLYENGRLV